MKKKEEILSYESAQEELQQIVLDLQSEAVRYDRLAKNCPRQCTHTILPRTPSGDGGRSG